ncbi:hypothetical protein C8R44DRAFT_894116 [Mycena epipterygia]|nr:hypothetical protein C8R44DRAFT_894116 [Mycena epipterygia]
MSVPPHSTGATADVRLSYGPLLIGVFFNMILFGASLQFHSRILILTAVNAGIDRTGLRQQLTYFQTPRKDPLWIRVLVWYVSFVETANAALDMAIMYEPLILHYGEIPDKLPTVFLTQPLCVILVGFPIQLFFIWRIRTLTESNIIPAIICLFAAAGFAGGVWTTVMVPIIARFSRIPLLYRSAVVWLISSAMTDICIAFRLAIALRQKKTGFEATDTVLDKIIRTTVQTGMLTALFSILDVTCFLILPGETVNFIWSIPLSKLYSNCLMSTLNARNNLRDTALSAGRAQQNMVFSKSARSIDGKPARATVTLPNSDQSPFANHQETFVGGGNEYGIRITRVVERV